MKSWMNSSFSTFFSVLAVLFMFLSRCGITSSFSVVSRSAALHGSRAVTHLPNTSRLLVRTMATKPGVASPEELRNFVKKAGDELVVIDVRNPDANVEPGDQKSLAVAPLPSDGVRPQALHCIWNRETKSLTSLPDDLATSTPIITHCGGGGRGQLAKEFLEAKGYTNVLNGGGPKETECWAEFGDK